MLGLTHFDQALATRASKATGRLYALVELVETLAIAIDLEVDDDPGHCFQEVHDCPNVAIDGRDPTLDLLARHKAGLIEGRIDVPAIPRLGPLRRGSLQEVNEPWAVLVWAVLLGSALHGEKRSPRLEDAVHFSRTDRKSTRLNSSHTVISYAVFCLKQK